MSESPSARRAVAEIRTGENPMAGARIGDRSIHQFWYLYAPYFRHVLLAPHRRPDSDQVTWSWQEAADTRPPTAPELAELRRRLSDANQALADGLANLDSSDKGSIGGGARSLETQVRTNLQELITRLCAKSDQALGGFACRTSSGLMLHSWGASIASVPYYPDSRHGGITGTVWVDGQTVTGVTVVLRSRQGVDLDHATSGRTGVFGFPNVAPGQYRVRVAGRSDFPTEGLAVTVGHETVGGLELRGGSSGPAGARGASTARSASGSKRRWLTGLALLTLLGAGALVWRYITKPTTSLTVGGKTPFAWQSASGKLVGTDGQAPADEVRQSGGAGSWSELSRTLAPPKILKTPHPGEAKDNSSDDGPSTPSATGLTGALLRAPEEKSPSDDSPGKKLLFPPDAKAPRGSDRAEFATTEPTGINAVPVADTARDEPDGEDARPPENRSLDPAPASDAKKRRTVSGNSLSAADNPSAETTLSGGMQLLQAEAFSTIQKGGSRSAQTARPAGPGGYGTSDQSPVAVATAESGMPAEAASGSRAESTDQLQAREGARPKEGVELARATALTATISAVSTGEETSENEEPARSETGNDKAPEKSPARTSLPAVRPTGTPSRSPEQTSPEDRADGNEESTPDAPATTEGPVKPATAAGKALSAPATPVPAPANPAEPDGIPSTMSVGIPSEREANSAARSSRAGRKKPSSSTTDQATTDSEMPANRRDPSSARPADDERGDGDGPWVSLGRVSSSAWQTRLVRDLILPTQPVPEGADDALEAMQADLLREMKAQMPSTFHQPVTSSGLAFELPPVETGPGGPLRWTDVASAGIAGSTVQGNRAELTWAGPNAPRNTGQILSDAAGREIVRVSMDQTGALKIKTRPGVRTWFWVGIEHAPVDATTLVLGQADPRLSWRLLEGTTDASDWPRDNRWRAGRGHRIDLPLGPTGVGPGNYTLALVDRVTGWAIMCNLTLR